MVFKTAGKLIGVGDKNCPIAVTRLASPPLNERIVFKSRVFSGHLMHQIGLLLDAD